MATKHILSETNPTYVTGADSYRVAFTVLLTPEHPDFAAMEGFVLPEHRRPEGYGLAFLESEEHSLVYIGTFEQIQQHRDGAVLDVSAGHCYAFWPDGQGWEQLIPANTWTPDGQGILTEFTHRGTTVTVYEYLADRDGTQVPMVAFHCHHCHNDHRIHHDHAEENRGPQNRRWIAAAARKHVRYADRECQPPDPRIVEAVTAVANKIHGGQWPVVTHESHCSTTGPCADIRHLRACAAAGHAGE
jgi:hypothetical protein